jgi:hypothetical protein
MIYYILFKVSRYNETYNLRWHQNWELNFTILNYPILLTNGKWIMKMLDPSLYHARKAPHWLIATFSCFSAKNIAACCSKYSLLFISVNLR